MIERAQDDHPPGRGPRTEHKPTEMAPGTAGNACSLDQRGASGPACGTNLWQRPPLTRNFFLVLVALTALWGLLFTVQNAWSMAVYAVILLTWAFG